MFHVLIVDDDAFSIEAILTSINWDTLNVKHIFSAESSKEAKDIFGRERIDVMLCDIEMYGEDGISLVTWVREKYPATINLFLTCHANFEYARDAVSLGAFDYLLKPIEYDQLQLHLSRALAEYQKRADLMAGTKKWFINHEVVADRFLWDYLLGENTVSALSIQETARKKDIFLPADGIYLPILATIQNYRQTVNSWYQNDIDFIFRNIAYEILSIQDCPLFIAAPSDTCKMLLFCYQSGLENMGDSQSTFTFETQVYKKLEELTNFLSFHFHIQIAVKTGKASFLQDLPNEFQNLRQNSQHLVSDASSSFKDQTKLYTDTDYMIDTTLNLNISRWIQLLFQDRPEELADEFCSYCSKHYQSKLHIYDLFFQAVLIELLKRNCNAYIIYTDKRIEAPNQITDVSHVPDQLYSLCTVIKENFASFSTGDSVISQIKSYICDHLTDDLSRETLAKKFFLNPNYLSTLFKRKTGMSLQDYILRERIKKSQYLLDTTNLPISEVHQYAGFSNSSYFSKIFKRELGITPQQYKRRGKK